MASEHHPVEDLAAYFVGTWRLDREIVDDAGQALGSFAGSAEFSADGEVLDYREEGVLELGSHRAPAYRALRYYLDGPGRALVYFDYGEFFHDLDLRQGWWSTNHPCRDDLYRGEYRMLGTDQWWQRWVVSGPTKNHTLTTSFQRE